MTEARIRKRQFQTKEYGKNKEDGQEEHGSRIQRKEERRMRWLWTEMRRVKYKLVVED